MAIESILAMLITTAGILAWFLVRLLRESRRSVPAEIVCRDQMKGNYEGFVEGEHWFLRRSLYWDGPCLDTTYFAYEALKAIDRLEIGNGPHRERLFKNHARELRAFVLDHYDDSLGGFRYCADATHASLYGTYSAICLLKALNQHSRFDPLNLEVLGRYLGDQDKALGTLEFIQACRVDGSGFAENKYCFNEPTVADTDIAILLLRDCGLAAPAGLEDVLIRYFLKEDGEGAYGFANLAREGFPYNCATHFALRALTFLREKRGGLEAVENLPLDGIRKFVRSCQKPDGGFALRPGEVSSLAYTYLSLIDLQQYLAIGGQELGTSNMPDGVDPQRLRSFVYESRADGGYVVETGDLHPPDVHATRAAVEIISRLRLSESIDDRELRRFKLSKTVDFIVEELGTGSGTFRGF